MSQHITAFRISFARGGAKVEALSKSRRGSQYLLAASAGPYVKGTREEREAQIAALITDVMRQRDLRSQ